MTPERWQQIDLLFHATLEYEPAQRAVFLASACEGDDGLRHEVESLLSFHDNTDSFIENPPGDVAAQLLGVRNSRFKPGDNLQNYKIIRQLGSGGMGEVYLAEDSKLRRQIALKLVPAEFTFQRDRVLRFELEARAASALNHPNIVTIHEIGESDNSHFLATEFVDGKTLRQVMMESAGGLRLDIVQILDIASQIASALAAAHSAGIVHRDIKPENIMIRRDGFVKVLDFGLAKLSPEIDTKESGMVNTNPGVVMGTVRYMSPEQARGFEVDARTDIWSLGAVVYEMLTGRTPFRGETSSHVIVSILEKEPEPLSKYAHVPSDLARMVAKMLRKDRSRRYQNSSDLALSLRSLKQEVERVHLKEPLQSRRIIDSLDTEKVQISAAQTVKLDTPLSTSSNKRPARRTLSSRTAVIFLILAVSGVAVGYALFELIQRSRNQGIRPSPFQAIELLKLTNSGRVIDSSISPDGKYVSYVVENLGKQSIWLRGIDNSSHIQIIAPEDAYIYGGTFSERGDYLYYIAKERNNTIGTLYRVPSLGGTPIKLIRDVDGPITLSPDEKQMAFVRGASTGERALIIVNSDGSGERKLASRMGYDAFSFGGPAWSPDGKSIVSGAAYIEENVRFLTLVEVSVMNGAIRPLTSHRWRSIGRVSWLRDGSGVVFTASELTAGGTSQLWYMDYQTGEANRISKDLQDYHGASVTTDAKTLVTKQTETISSLWIVPHGDADHARQILSHKDDEGLNNSYFYRTRFSWMPDGRIMYTSLVNGDPSIWVMTAAGVDNKQLIGEDKDSTFPSVTSDSRYVVYVSETSGFSNVWRMDLDGSNPKQLTTGSDNSWAWCSPNGRWVVYHSGNQGRRTLWRVPIEGGTPQQLTNYPSAAPVVSPDGKWIATYYRLENKAPWRLGIIPFDGGEPVKSFEVPAGVLFQSLVRWTPDGSALAYILNKDGVSNIWTQPLDGGPAKQYSNFKSDQIFWFEWSQDGKQLGVSRGAITSDVVMIRR